MQVFLELVHSHPLWLRTFLLEYPYDTRPTPRTWASDMLSWAIQAASKRCAHQLQAYVSACLRQRLILVPDGAAGSQNPASQQQQQQAQQLAERSLRQQLPPLGQALVAVIEQLVALVRSCLPRGPGAVLCTQLDIPAEPANVLLAYAESSPWAAAHLLQVCVCVYVCRGKGGGCAADVERLCGRPVGAPGIPHCLGPATVRPARLRLFCQSGSPLNQSV